LRKSQRLCKILPLLVGMAACLQIVDPFQGWMVLLVGFGGVWLISYLWARSLLRNVTLVRETRMGWVQVGDVLEERFTLRNQGWIPAPWVEIIDRSTLPGHRASRVTGVDGDSENSWTTKSICMRRGAFTLGPTMLRMGDPFGLYTVSLEYPGCTNMMVMPPVVPLPSIQVASGGRAGEGRRRIGAFERTVNAAGVREYQSGDSLSRVHWRTSARRDDLYVRLFESTPSSDWWIVLDLDANVQVGQSLDSTLEHGIILAASLTDSGLRSRRSVGLLGYGDDLIWLPPRPGPAQRWEVLRALALASAGERPLGQLLGQVSASLRGTSSLIIITCAVTESWIESLIPLLWRGVVPTVLLLDSSSFGGRCNSNGVAAALLDLGIAHYVITRALLDRPALRPRQRETEWKISPRGRAIMQNRPRDMSWRRVA
jgi:uncharacterized protein (DUF58 family)